jgi:WD40 repeat protein
MPVPECIEIGIGLTTALAHLHKHGLVHRDVKPSNVIFIDGVPKLADIGLVTDFDATVSCVGTEGFLPPEGPGTPRGDLYALGKVLYEVSTGKDRQDYPEPPTLLGEFADRQELLELGEIIKRACAANPFERYANAEQMQAELLLLKTGKSVRHTRMLERRVKLLTRTAIGLLIVMVLGVAPYAWALLEARRARQAEAHSREQLWSSDLAQAQAIRWSHRAGARFEGLELIKKAVAIRPSLELRHEAIAYLAMPDIRVLSRWGELRKDKAPSGFNFVSGGFSIEFERYALSDSRGNIRLLSLKDNHELVTLPGIGLRVTELCYSADGRFLAASYDGSPDSIPVRVWDLERQQIIPMDAPIRACRTVEFDSTSKHVAVADLHGLIFVMDLSSGSQLRSFEPRAMPSRLRFDPAGRRLAISSDADPVVQILDIQTGRTNQSLPHPVPVRGMAWHPGGVLLATGASDGQVYLWDTGTGTTRAILAGHQNAIVNVSFSHNGRLLASTSWDGDLRLWSVATAKEVCRVPAGGYSASFSLDDCRLVFGGDGNPQMGEVARGDELREFALEPPDPAAFKADFSNDGRLLATGHDHGVRIWDTQTGAQLLFLPMPNGRAGIFCPVSQQLITSDDGGLKRWPITWSSTNPTSAPELGSPVLLGPNGVIGTESIDHRETMLESVRDGELHLLDLRSRVDRALPSVGIWFFSGCLSPDGNWCVGCNASTNRICIFQASDGRFVRFLKAENVGTVMFSPDNKWLASCGTDEYLFWETGSWRCTHRIPRKATSGYWGEIAFSADGRIAAISITPRLIELIAVATGEELATLEAPDSQNVGFLKFSPDSTQLAVTAFHAPVRLWDLRKIREQLAAMNLDWGTAASRLVPHLMARQARGSGREK